MVILLSVTSRAQVARKPPPVFRSGTELVLVNVVVRDRNGAIVRGLRQADFALSEDDKAQTITSFDFEEPDRAAPELAASETTAVLGAAPPSPYAVAPPTLSTPVEPRKVDMRGRRLIVLFFDLSSMEPEAVTRAVSAAHEYVDRKRSPAKHRHIDVRQGDALRDGYPDERSGIDVLKSSLLQHSDVIGAWSHVVNRIPAGRVGRSAATAADDRAGSI